MSTRFFARRFSLKIAVVASWSGVAFGAWSSGGGELIKDAHNPWFLQNTETVTYCIIRDANHFHLNDEEGFPLEALIGRALQFWQNEFRTAYNPGGDMRDGVKVATQSFVVTDCSEATDIRFQFGFLTDGQLAEMRRLSLDPRGYVSLAVRTDYDAVNLRGRGFVYLAADSGPLRPSSEEMLDQPWATGSGSLTYKVLVHELGHVFGLQHQSNYLSVMAPEYPEAIVNRSNRDMGYAYYVPSFFQFTQPRDLSFCFSMRIQPIAARFFDIPADWDCYSADYRDNKLEVWARPTRDAEKQLIGIAEFAPTDSPRLDFPLSVWLPEEQTVFPSDPNRRGRILYGPMIKHSHFKGAYKTLTRSVERQISLYLSPILGWNKIGGILDGKQLIDIQSNQ